MVQGSKGCSGAVCYARHRAEAIGGSGSPGGREQRGVARSRVVRRRLTPRAPGATALVALLLALFAARRLHGAQLESFTVDEPHYVGTGLYLWQSGDYHHARSLRFHPPLAFHLASLPLLGLDLEHLERTPALGGELVNGAQPSPDLVRFLSRLPFVLLGVWCGWLLYCWAREAAGGAAGLWAVFLYSFSPLVLAFSGLAHSDITVSVFFLQTLYAFWRWLRRPSPPRLLLAGASLGLALLSKLSALLLLPILAVQLLGSVLGWPGLPGADGAAALPRRRLRAIGSFATILAIALGVLWIGYDGSLGWSPVAEGPLRGLPLPGYLHSLLFDVEANARGRPIFFFGELLDSGRWYHLPVAFLLKTPIAFWALFVLALSARPRRAGLGAFLAVPALLYAAVACFWLRVPLGVRYLLPLQPLLCLFLATRLPGRPGRRAAVAGAAAAWLAWSSLAIHPHYLAYFNELLGGPRVGYRQLVESNLDWGQDLGSLARYLRSRGNPPLHLAYFGPEEPARWGIRAVRLSGCDPVAGLVAVSATLLQGVYSTRNPFRPAPAGCFDWLLAREPVAQPGFSILVYEVAEGPAGAAR